MNGYRELGWLTKLNTRLIIFNPPLMSRQSVCHLINIIFSPIKLNISEIINLVNTTSGNLKLICCIYKAKPIHDMLLHIYREGGG